MTRRRTSDIESNFYIAYTDMAFTMVMVMTLIAVLVVLYGRIGWDSIQYKKAQAQVEREVKDAYAQNNLKAPYVNRGRNDPPGAQRWVFNQQNLFTPGTARLTVNSRRALLEFARVVREHDDQWRRLRIEGHTRPPRPGEADNWQLSAARAEMVTRVFSGAGHIPAYKMAIAGRAGQNPIFKASQTGNERVEILIEYANSAK
ncbi:flagellar motor protein MotB [Deinococcus sp.]|uniref:OmpA/MotB family protein n=1 Tax=Deinococcus sp. TaxID=47478 RepID=UPI00391A5EDE